ncbi:ABC transporter substrate-binding protein [Jatrophihabitans endophyticus]|uniref:ABC transporter substrate-binding protein n=1 Tax=Jatrophihabitans endophyticus TaxID=1206085 RepID=UPI0009354098
MTASPRPRRGLPGAVVAVATATMLLAACTSGGDDTTGGGSSTPRSGGTLRFAVSSDAGCVDPQQVGSNDTIYSLRQVVDSLTDQDPATGKIVPWLAKSWTVSKDATTFTFKLRPGVTFSDGSKLTAQVVKENFDAVPDLGPLAVLAKGYLSGIESVTAVDPLTVRVSFAKPNAQFLQASSTFSLGIESSASVKRTPQQRCSKGIVASGPFTLAKYVPNQSITLAKRRGYDWGSSLWRKRGEAYLDRLVFTIVPEAGVRTGSLQSGQVDAIGSVGKADEAALKGAGIALQTRANPGIVFNLAFNNARPLVRDVRVRQAIQVAVNRQEIVDAVYPTGTRPATSVLSHTTPQYANLGSALGYDQAKARSLLTAAGWTVGSGGIRVKDGRRLSLSVRWFANAATNKPALELLQQQLKAVGVELVLEETPIASIATVQQSGNFDALWGNITRADPDILRSSYSTKLANVYRLSAGPLDPVLAGQAAATTPARRAGLAAQAQRLVVGNAYAIPVVELETELGVAKKVHDLRFEASSRIQLHDTWIG